METFSVSLAICAGNSSVPSEFPAQRPVTRYFDVFFGLRLNKRLSKHPWSWWFETLSRPLWRHCNVFLIVLYIQKNNIRNPFLTKRKISIKFGIPLFIYCLRFVKYRWKLKIKVKGLSLNWDYGGLWSGLSQQQTTLFMAHVNAACSWFVGHMDACTRQSHSIT